MRDCGEMGTIEFWDEQKKMFVFATQKPFPVDETATPQYFDFKKQEAENMLVFHIFISLFAIAFVAIGVCIFCKSCKLWEKFNRMIVVSGMNNARESFTIPVIVLPYGRINPHTTVESNPTSTALNRPPDYSAVVLRDTCQELRFPEVISHLPVDAPPPSYDKIMNIK